MTPILLQDYRSHFQNIENQKPATINKALATLKTFFTWAVQAGHTDNNPSLKVRMKRVQQTHAPKWLNDNQQNRLLNSLDAERNEFKQVRDRAIILTMLDTGLRVEEVTELKVQHVEMKNETVTVVNGKGGKYRSVLMTKELKKALKTWLVLRSASDKAVHQSSDYLFVSERAGQMTTRGIAYMVDGYLERCGLLERGDNGSKTEGYSCHSLRHTFCKRLVNAGWPIQNAARMAGHDSIQTTMRYVALSQDELKTAMKSL